MIRYYFVFFLIAQLNLGAQNSLKGTIVDDKGQAIAGAHITANQRSAVTDLDGVFFFHDFVDTVCYLTIRALGYGSLQDSFVLEGDRTINYTLVEHLYDLDMIKLSASWIKPGQPFTYAQLNKKQIKEQNLGRDLPYLLQNLPATVVTSDAGTGIGYTGIRVRGSDATRINVTLDGVPVNDAESHGVFWVDLPDLASNAGNIQVQRGVGTSTNGAGAFGATINVKTAGPEDHPYTSVDLSGGSFNTLRANAKFGTGLINNRLSLQGSFSKITSAGYIDRASSDLSSFYLSGVYLHKKQSLKVNILRGKEITYQAWNGVPAQYVDDPTLRTFNTAGAKGDGTYHDDEVDNYGQTHVHAIYHLEMGGNLHLQTTLHYTHGEGYYEQYRPEDQLSAYGLIYPKTQDDLIRRRWLDNDFYGAVFSMNKMVGDDQTSWTLGGGINEYMGNHFGEVIWVAQAEKIEAKEYYRNDARKRDANLYGQFQHQLSDRTRFFADLQWRGVSYQFEGLERDFSNSRQQVAHHFFNPKLGLESQLGKLVAYYSVGVAHREPNRDDYVQSTPMSWPQPERLIDHELGWRYGSEKLAVSLNLFYMSYRNQLVLTGAINDVGEYTRVNVSKSYRVGSEFSMSSKIGSILNLGGTLTWNQSRIPVLNTAIDNWDTGSQVFTQHRNVPISFSPEWLASAFVDLTVFKRSKSEMHSRIDHRYVSKQYIDNTGDNASLLEAYQQTDLNISWTWYPGGIDKVTLRCQVINLFDQFIISNAWIYRYLSESYDARADDPHVVRLNDGSYKQSGYYPQAGIHALVGLAINF